MNFKTLFFSWDGRSNRKPYWVGIVTVELLSVALGAVFTLSGLGAAGDLLAGLILAYPRICVITKRLHDVNRSGWWQVLPNILTGILNRGAQALETTEANLLALMVYVVALVVMFGFLIWLGSVRGQDRKNDFGPPVGRADVVEVFE